MKRRLLALCGALIFALLPAGAVHTAPKSTFLYVFDNGVFDDSPRAARVHIFRVTDGIPVPPPSPFTIVDSATGQGARGAAYSSKRKTLFVNGSRGMITLQVPTNGLANRVAGSPFRGTEQLAQGHALTPAQRGKRTFLYAGFDTSRLAHFEVLADGTLKDIDGPQTVPDLDSPNGMAFGKDTLVVSDFNTLHVFSVAANGTLRLAGDPITPEPPAHTQGFGCATSLANVVADPSGAFFYVPAFVSDGCSGAIHVFKRGKNSKLTPLSNSPVAAAIRTGPLLAVGKKFVIAAQPADSGQNDLQVFSRSRSGALQPKAVSSSGLGPELSALAFDEKTGWVALTNQTPLQNGKTLRYFRLNQQTGALTPLGSLGFSGDEITAAVIVQR